MNRSSWILLVQLMLLSGVMSGLIKVGGLQGSLPPQKTLIWLLILGPAVVMTGWLSWWQWGRVRAPVNQPHHLSQQPDQTDQ